MSTRCMSTPLEILCCYARKDQKMLEHLKTHLVPLQRQGRITIWSDTNIDAGEEWQKELHQHLETAAIILLLISPDFMASDYCCSTEMTRAIARHDENKARVIPILLRPVVSWNNAPFAKLQMIPKDAKAVTKWPRREEAFYDIAKQISEVVDALIPIDTLTPVNALTPQIELIQPVNQGPTTKTILLLPLKKTSRKRRLVLAGFTLGAMVIAIALSFAPFGIFPFSGPHALVLGTPTSLGTLTAADYTAAEHVLQEYCYDVENHDYTAIFQLESSRLQISDTPYTLPAIATDVTEHDYDECVPKAAPSLNTGDSSKAYFLVTLHAKGFKAGTMVFLVIDLAGVWKIDDTGCQGPGDVLVNCF